MTPFFYLDKEFRIRNVKSSIIKIFLSFFLSATAGSTFTIFTTEIEHINTVDRKGPYNKFLKKIEDRTSFKFNVEFLPMNRGIRGFKRDTQSCMFPFSKGDSVSAPKGVVLSKPMGAIELYAINFKNDELVTAKNLGSKKRVAIRALYKEGINFKDDKEYFFVSTERQLFLMLEKKRVDYILASVPDIYLSFKGGKTEFESKYQFDQSFKVKEVREYMACHKSNKQAEVLFNYLKSL